MTAAKLERCEIANQVIIAISRHGRRFFRNERDSEVTHFEVDGRGYVWLVDHYSKRRIFVAYNGRWRGFTNGGTLRRLCEALRDYIRFGKPISSSHFGPWPEWYCDGDLWGYGAEDMARVREEIAASPAVRRENEPPKAEAA